MGLVRVLFRGSGGLGFRISGLGFLGFFRVGRDGQDAPHHFIATPVCMLQVCHGTHLQKSRVGEPQNIY